MPASARSIMVFGIYLLLSGLSFIFIPNLLLPLFGFAPTTEIWIRLVGLLAAILGGYFLNSVRVEDRAFYRATILARLAFFTGVVGFVVTRLAPPMLLAFGLIDVAGAAWTWWTMRKG